MVSPLYNSVIKHVSDVLSLTGANIRTQGDTSHRGVQDISCQIFLCLREVLGKGNITLVFKPTTIISFPPSQITIIRTSNKEEGLSLALEGVEIF